MKKTKRALVALGILAGLFLIAWIAFFATSSIIALVLDMAVKNNGETHSFVAFFATHMTTFLIDGIIPGNNAAAPWLSYVTYGVAFLALVMAIVWFIVSIAKKRAKHLIWFIFYPILLFPVIDGLCSVFANPTDSDLLRYSYLTMIRENDLTWKIIGFGTLISAGLAALFGLIVWLVGIVAMSKYPGGKKKEAEEELPQEEPETVDEAPLFVAEQPAAAPEYVVEQEPEVEPEPKEEPLDNKSLAELIRDIVRDEIARNNLKQETHTNSDNQTITGATFGGPLVVQYFNGVGPANAPAPEQKKEEPEAKPEPQPVPEPKAEESKVQPEPAPEPKAEEPAPIEEPKAEEASEEKQPIIRISFAQRLLESEQDVKDSYNEIKNEILSWGLKSRVSFSGDTFRLHRKTYIKITVAGKSLKLYFALDPANYADSKIPVQDASNKNLYTEIPLVFKIKSGLSMRRAKQLVQDVCEQDGLEQGQLEEINWVKELEVEFKEGNASKDDDD